MKVGNGKENKKNNITHIIGIVKLKITQTVKKDDTDGLIRNRRRNYYPIALVRHHFYRSILIAGVQRNYVQVFSLIASLRLAGERCEGCSDEGRSWSCNNAGNVLTRER